MSESNGKTAESPKISHPKKGAFLAAFVNNGNVTKSADAAGIDRRTHYQWCEDDAEYAEAFCGAQEAACDHLEAEARRRAVDGWEESVFFKDEVVGTKRRYSDTLLIFLLKGNNPEKFAERHQSIHEHNHTHSLEQRRERLSALDERLGLGVVVDEIPDTSAAGDSAAAKTNGHARNGKKRPGILPPPDTD